MSTPPGQYSTLDELTAASGPAPAAHAAAEPPFQSQTEPPAITLGAKGGPAISLDAVYITQDDFLQLSVWNSNPALTSVTVQIRMLKPDGQIVITASSISGLTSDRTQNVETFGQLEGFILGVVVGPPGVAVLRGQTFVNVALVRGTPAAPLMTEVLLADYLTSALQPSWPYGRVFSAVEGPGWVHTIASAAPAPGNQAAIVQPPNTRWRVISIETSLQTSNFPGPRTVVLDIIDAVGNTVMLIPAAAQQTASLTWNYTFGSNLSLFQANVYLSAPIAATQTMGAGTQFEVGAQALNVADQFGVTTMAVEEWIDV
jgi:hypothetical protein